MTRAEAMELVGKYFYGGEHAEDEAAGVEALKVLIETDVDHTAEFTALLGGYYYEKKDYGLALKYYEMAAEEGSIGAMVGLGYIFYYGRTGEKDYEKAFRYFSEAADLGSSNARYKLADMYKNGYYVQENYGKYKEIIEELYEDLKDENIWAYPVGDVLSRMARIRKEEGRDEEALALLIKAENTIRLRLKENHFWGDLNVMKWLKEDHYRWTAFDPANFTLYDLYHLLKTPVKVQFTYLNETETAESSEEDGEMAVCFNGKWFRTVDEFFRSAEIHGEKLTRIEKNLVNFRVM